MLEALLQLKYKPKISLLTPTIHFHAQGDRVAVLAPGGGNAEYTLVDEGHVMPIPTHVTMQEAGGIPEVWLTAYQLLHFVGNFPSFCLALEA